MVTSGGGCSTAVAISWPARIKQGGRRRQFHHLIDIAPTILESVGLPEPKRVNGVEQMPIEGVSMLYTFDDAEAEDRHTTQYFELAGSRAIYHEGWWAGTRHGLDGVTDAGQRVRAVRKGCLGALRHEERFWPRNGPVGGVSREAQGIPSTLRPRSPQAQHLSDGQQLLRAVGRGPAKLVSGNTASFTRGTVRLPEEAIIDIKNRSFSVVAEVENPDGDAEGILVTLGGETGGFAFLVLDRRPTFIYSWLGLEKYTIASSDPLPRGSCTIRFDFAYDGGGAGKGGTGTLSVNEKTVAEGRLEKTVPIHLLDRRHLRCGGGLGHASVVDVHASIHVHRHPEESDSANREPVNDRRIPPTEVDPSREI